MEPKEERKRLLEEILDELLLAYPLPPHRHRERLLNTISQNIRNGRHNWKPEAEGKKPLTTYIQRVLDEYCRQHHAINQLANDDYSEWNKLWERQYRLAYHYLINFDPNNATIEVDAHDLTVDSCLKIKAKLDSFPFDCHFGAWTTNFVFNGFRNWRRKYQRANFKEQPVEDEVLQRILGDSSFQAWLLSEEESTGLAGHQNISILKNTISKLNNRQRRLILGTFVEGKNDQELADELTLQVSSVKVLRSKVLKMLRDKPAKG